MGVWAGWHVGVRVGGCARGLAGGCTGGVLRELAVLHVGVLGAACGRMGLLTLKMSTVYIYNKHQQRHGLPKYIPNKLKYANGKALRESIFLMNKACPICHRLRCINSRNVHDKDKFELCLISSKPLHISH